MKTLAILNQKGGCGKTTTAINLGASLAVRGKRVLLCDLDPQGHASLGLSRGKIPSYPRTLSDALLDGGALDGCLTRISEGFDLAPSKPSLQLAEQRLHDLAGGEKRLRTVLDWVREEYEYAILDCPPGGGVLIANALHAADEVILAVETSFYSLYGVSQLLEAIKQLAPKKELRVRALATLYDRRTGFAREILQDLSRFFGSSLYNTVIHHNVKLREASSYGLPITEYDPKARGCQDYLALADEVLGERVPQATS
jgi:chromosome partitioning protein